MFSFQKKYSWILTQMLNLGNYLCHCIRKIRLN